MRAMLLCRLFTIVFIYTQCFNSWRVLFLIILPSFCRNFSPQLSRKRLLKKPLNPNIIELLKKQCCLLKSVTGILLFFVQQEFCLKHYFLLKQLCEIRLWRLWVDFGRVSAIAREVETFFSFSLDKQENTTKKSKSSFSYELFLFYLL